MATPVEVPKLGNTVEECLISRWVKRKGEVVAAGDLIAEIETDKATFEITSPVNGTVIETFFEEGALVPVFTNLVVIGEPGESAEAFRPRGGAPAAEIDTPPQAAVGPAATGGSSRGRGFSGGASQPPGKAVRARAQSAPG